MPLDCPTNHDLPSPQGDPYDALLTVNLEPRWTDTQLDAHIAEAVKYGIRMERARILGATQALTYPESGVISEAQPEPGGAV